MAAEGEPDPHSGLAHLIQHADLVIDTAADAAVTRYLAGLCWASSRPFLHASATAGAHGGIVALIRPGAAGCWWCLLHHRRDQTFPFPPAADPVDGAVVPAGCTEPTFTGTGADLATIAAHAARTAIAHLSRDPTPTGSVLYVAALRDHHGRPRPVSWPPGTSAATPTARCTTCQRAAASSSRARPVRRLHNRRQRRTVRLAAGRNQQTATASTLRTQQRKQHSSAPASTAGAVLTPNPARQEVTHHGHRRQHPPRPRRRRRTTDPARAPRRRHRPLADHHPDLDLPARPRPPHA